MPGKHNAKSPDGRAKPLHLQCLKPNSRNQFWVFLSSLYQNTSPHALNCLYSAALKLAQLREAVDTDLRLFIAL